MPKWLRIPLTGLAFLIFHIGVATISWVLLPWHRRRTRGLPPDQARRELECFIHTSYRWMTLGTIERLGLVNFRYPPLPPDLPRGTGYVVVANHPSLLDVIALKATIPGLTCLVKSSMFKPHIRPLLEASGDFRGPKGQSAVGQTRVLDTFVERLRQGHPVLVFPEGTRSPVGGLRRFRRGAFEAAIRAGVPVVPVLMKVVPPILLKGDEWYNVPPRPSHFELEFLPVLSTDGADPRELTRALKQTYTRRLAMLESDEGVRYDAERATC